MQKVVLYGGGIAAEKFWCKYKNRFEIEYIIDREAERFFS